MIYFIVPGRLHLIRGVEGREVDLEPVVVLPVELHLLEPVAPQDLTGEIGRPGLNYYIEGRGCKI